MMASSTVLVNGLCTATPGGMYTDSTIQKALASAMAQSGDTTKAYCAANVNSWAVSIPLKSNPATSWCVGNVGKAGTTTTPGLPSAFSGC